MTVLPRQQRYRLQECLSPELAVMVVQDAFRSRVERQLWGTGRLRKDNACCICSKVIQRGEQAYRPMGNAFNRYERAHVACVEDQKK